MSLFSKSARALLSDITNLSGKAQRSIKLGKRSGSDRPALLKRMPQFSPLFLLPAELLIHIAYLGAAPYGSVDALSFPLLFSHISSHLRALLISTPSLWSFLPLAKGFHVSMAPSRIESLLERSSNLPLDIIFDLGPNNGLRLPGDEYEIFERTNFLLSPAHAHMDRWRSISLSIPSTACVNAVLEACAAPTPMLESLTIFFVRDIWTPQRSVDWERAGLGKLPMPKLKTVHIHGASIPVDLPLFRSASITSLHLANFCITARPSLFRLIEMLKGLPCLETLALVHALPVEDLEPFTAIELPVLQTLDLSCNHTPSVLCFLKTFWTPKLSSLVLGSPPDPTLVEDLSPLMLFLSTARYPGLTTLRLAQGQVGEGAIAALQERMNTLTWVCGPTEPKNLDAGAANQRWMET